MTFPTAPHTEVTVQGDILYTEVVRENVRKLESYVEIPSPGASTFRKSLLETSSNSGMLSSPSPRSVKSRRTASRPSTTASFAPFERAPRQPRLALLLPVAHPPSSSARRSPPSPKTRSPSFISRGNRERTGSTRAISPASTWMSLPKLPHRVRLSRTRMRYSLELAKAPSVWRLSRVSFPGVLTLLLPRRATDDPLSSTTRASSSSSAVEAQPLTVVPFNQSKA